MAEAIKEKPGITILYRLFYALISGIAAYECIRNAYAFQGRLYVHLLVMIFSLFLLLALDCFIGRAASCATGVLLALIALYHVKYKVIEITETSEEQSVPLFSEVSVKEMWCVYLIAMAALTLWIFLEGFFVLKAVSVAAVAGLLAISMFTGKDLPKMSVCMFFLYIVSNVLEFLEKYWEKRGAENKKAYFVWIAPFLVLYFVLIAVIPVRTTPYDWAFARNVYRQVRERFYTVVQNITLPFSGSEDFGISTTGFSEEDIFFGDVTGSQKEVIHMKTNASFDNAIYLTGRICDTFDGRTWKSTIDTKRKDVVFDALETFYAVYQYDRDHKQDYIRKIDLDMEYRFFHTKCLFTPLKTLRVTGVEESRDYDAKEGWYQFRRQKNFGTKYKTTYYVLNRRHPDFVRMIEAVSAGTSALENRNGGSITDASGGEEDFNLSDPEKAWNRVLNKQDMASGVLRYEDLQSYRKRMQGYQKAPEVSEAVQDWLVAIYEGADSDYEKMVRLEEALRGFSYNTRPGKLPGNVKNEKDFLDYFLLDKKEGYCSYFATVFVVLAREAGLPARFVEGYCVPREKMGNSLESNIMSGMAHAWPEVYFEGVGWIPFEPTPGFAGCRNTMWRTNSDKLAEETGENAIEEDASVRDLREDGGDLELESEEEEIMQPEEDPFVYDFMLFIVFLVVGIVAIFLLFILLDAIREKVKTAGMDAESRFRRTFRRNLQILEAMGYKRLEIETLSEFNNRLPEREAFIENYEAVFYGNLQIDGILADCMEESGKQLLGRLKNEKRGRYYLIRCLLYLRRAR